MLCFEFNQYRYSQDLTHLVHLRTDLEHLKDDRTEGGSLVEGIVVLFVEELKEFAAIVQLGSKILELKGYIASEGSFEVFPQQFISSGVPFLLVS